MCLTLTRSISFISYIYMKYSCKLKGIISSEILRYLGLRETNYLTYI